MKKLGFCECVETRTFLVFASTSRSKQNERNPEHPYIGIGGKENVCEISAKNIQLYGS